MVRRPLLQGAVFFVLPILICEYLGAGICGCVGAGLLAVYKYVSDERHRKLLFICIIFYSVSFINVCYHNNIPDPLYELVGENVTLSGKVLKVQVKNEGTDDESATITVRQESEGTSKLVIRWFGQGADMAPGDWIAFSGCLENPAGRRNPNCFDYSMYLKSINVFHVMTVNDVTIIRKGSGLQSKLYRIRRNYIDQIRSRTDDRTAAFINGVMFGDKSDIEESILEDFQRNGTAHILAVSGLHIGIIYGFISRLWIWRKGWEFTAFNGCFFLCYCILAAFSPSVIRASVMVLLNCLAKQLNRKYDITSAAFAVVTCMLLINPWSMYNTGFQMSFLAVMSMALIIPYIKAVKEGALAGSTAIQLGLMPFVVYNFNYIPLGAFLVNVPIIALTSILVPVCLVCMFVPSFDVIIKAIVDVILRINDATCIDGITTINMVSPPRFMVCFIYIFMLIFLSEEGRLFMGRKRSRKVIFTAVAFIICVSGIFGYATKTGFENAEITFVDVGQGDCIHVKTEDNKNYLVDGGGSENYQVGKKTLRPYLLKNGVSHIDAAMVTHLHTDHYQGIIELCKEGMVDKLIVYEGNQMFEDEILADTGLKREDLIYVGGGDKLNLGKGARADILWPEKKSVSEYKRSITSETDENEISLIIKVTVNDVDVLVTGDVDAECEESMIKAKGETASASVLKVAHHGSRYSWSDSFMDAVKPEMAVIQVGKNNYGHPTSEVLDGLEARGIPVMRNDLMGAIGLDVRKGQIIGQVHMIENR